MSYMIYCNFYIQYFVYYVENDSDSRDWTHENEWGSRPWIVESGCGSRVTLMTGKNESSLNSWDGMMSRVRSLESEWVIWVWTRESEKDEGHNKPKTNLILYSCSIACMECWPFRERTPRHRVMCDTVCYEQEICRNSCSIACMIVCMINITKQNCT